MPHTLPTSTFRCTGTNVWLNNETTHQYFIEFVRMIVNFDCILFFPIVKSLAFNDSSKNTPVAMLNDDNNVLSRITELIILAALFAMGFVKAGKRVPNHKWPNGAP